VLALVLPLDLINDLSAVTNHRTDKIINKLDMALGKKSPPKDPKLSARIFPASIRNIIPIITKQIEEIKSNFRSFMHNNPRMRQVSSIDFETKRLAITIGRK
jgi:hypothetical protein